MNDDSPVPIQTYQPRDVREAMLDLMRDVMPRIASLLQLEPGYERIQADDDPMLPPSLMLFRERVWDRIWCGEPIVDLNRHLLAGPTTERMVRRLTAARVLRLHREHTLGRPVAIAIDAALMESVGLDVGTLTMQVPLGGDVATWRSDGKPPVLLGKVPQVRQTGIDLPAAEHEQMWITGRRGCRAADTPPASMSRRCSWGGTSP